MDLGVVFWGVGHERRGLCNGFIGIVHPQQAKQGLENTTILQYDHDDGLSNTSGQNVSHLVYQIGDGYVGNTDELCVEHQRALELVCDH